MIHIYSTPAFQPEKLYGWNLLLNEILGIPFQVHFSAAEHHYRLVLPNGAEILVADHFFSRKTDGSGYSANDLPTHIRHFNSPFDATPLVALFGDETFQKAPGQVSIGTDLLASAFFMVTRWEESVKPERDQYGRFPAAASCAVQHEFLDRPVVHEWAEYLWQALVLLGWPETQRKHYHFETVLSCDVDHPRLWWRQQDQWKTWIGAIFRKNTLAEWRYWRNHDFGMHRDPYHTFEELVSWTENQPVQFNFLSERPRHFDCWYDIHHPEIRELIFSLKNDGHTIGFHPSREAFADRERFENELNILRRVADTEVVSGRHHYLCFAAPETWQVWNDSNMETDSTLGYPEKPGFRTGMCRAYPVFQFKTRKALALREQALVAMDVTLRSYLQYDPVKTGEILFSLRRQVERFNGQFTVLWHNSSVYTPYWEAYAAQAKSVLQGRYGDIYAG